MSRSAWIALVVVALALLGCSAELSETDSQTTIAPTQEFEPSYTRSPDTPTSEATNTPEPTATSLPTSTPTAASTPVPTITPELTATPSPTATDTPTQVPTNTPLPSPTSTPPPPPPTVTPAVRVLGVGSGTITISNQTADRPVSISGGVPCEGFDGTIHEGQTIHCEVASGVYNFSMGGWNCHTALPRADVYDGTSVFITIFRLNDGCEYMAKFCVDDLCEDVHPRQLW
jgi:hypothetical protein